MLYYDRIDVSEAIDINKTNVSKECIIFHYWFFFLDGGFKSQQDVCNGCHDVSMMFMNFDTIAVLNIHSVD